MSGGVEPEGKATTLTLAFLIGVLFTAACVLTSGDNDFFESPLWWPGWVLLPLIAGVWSYRTPEVRGWMMALVLVGPQATWVILEGVFLTRPDEGANLWPIGLVFVTALGGLVLAGAEVGSK